MSQLHFGIFESFQPQTGGTHSWPHPLDDGEDFLDPERWVRMARVMDETGYDFLFLADQYGYPIVGDDISTVAVERGINFPTLDPIVLVAALLRETENLGFVVTATTGIDHPLQMARRFTALDHLSAGRIGWNIVTGASQNAQAELLGHETLVPHDVRYEMADEYVRLARSYWEDSWEDGALVMVADQQLAVRRDLIHRTMFEGSHYQSRGYYTSPPSPQRTPVLFQAGTSPAGRAFAATHAECVFVQATVPAHTARSVADIRQRAADAGRDPRQLRLMAGMTAIVADTEAEARALETEFDALQTDEIVAALYAGNTGIDLLSLDPDKTLRDIMEAGGLVGQLGTSNIERFLGSADTPAPTVREILDQLRGRGTRGFRVVGNPDQVVDQIEALAAETDLDGFLIEPAFGSRDVEVFGREILSRLRDRGRLAPPVGSTLRERMRETEGPLADRLPAKS
ncbi:FMN-dependent oxidoreductase (nitrilotriacetate monooxygenase family) [Microbacterium halimionae]|uniref:FMN-dependent oxidoreductase (Nitrilotriacetate monooxygenase family) n=1 Tax=Microbacterium halimionae TaxID=1526413 RepID=A0A7W3PM01_9MICO|nr:NtaA/DmoA family FMN-dependent monooxygenase [Microbacterium halimionae]MBA8816477.1 FMN-dependent oxidoreductase (nitrilotriacetate monooxygenase family) [Microbacterium halimionae]NII95336.1 FMN-dependent oxidoreductase (nitrilotriacetate monooxygenase family) [Microbacterium halimionae]